jgi:hypothetical protein
MSSRSSRRVSRRPRRNAGRLLLAGPAQMRANVELRHQFRFTSTSAAATAISDVRLLTAAGVMATFSVVGHNINASVKVNKIEIWAPPASQGSAVTCSVLFPVGNTSPAREFSDTSVSTSIPAHCQCSPPPLSLAAFWQAGTGSQMFTLVAPPGSIIDVWLSLIILDGDEGNAVTATLVGATVGSVYYTSLDSGTSAGSIYKPVSLATL